MRDGVVKKIYWLCLIFRQSHPCLCIVIISLPSILPRILCFMKEPNTLRLTVILLEMLGRKRWLRSSSHRLQSSWLISLSKLSHLMFFSNLCNKLGMLDVYAPARGGVLSWVISIGLLGCYPYTLLVLYIISLLLWIKLMLSFEGFYFSTHAKDMQMQFHLALKAYFLPRICMWLTLVNHIVLPYF